jgi:hypothetical protein
MMADCFRHMENFSQQMIKQPTGKHPYHLLAGTHYQQTGLLKRGNRRIVVAGYLQAARNSLLVASSMPEPWLHPDFVDEKKS